MPEYYYALHCEENGTWAVVDPAAGGPVTVRDRTLAGLDRQQAFDAIRLLSLVDRLRPRKASAQAGGDTGA